jgi:hypothetical protein
MHCSLPDYVLRVTLRLSRCRVGDDGPLVMRARVQGFSRLEPCSSLLNIILGGQAKFRAC